MKIGNPKSSYIDKSIFLIKLTKAAQVSDLFLKLTPYSIFSENDLTWRMTTTGVWL